MIKLYSKINCGLGPDATLGHRFAGDEAYLIQAMPKENLSLGFPTSSDTNQLVQPQKMARVLKFWIKSKQQKQLKH